MRTRAALIVVDEARPHALARGSGDVGIPVAEAADGAQALAAAARVRPSAANVDVQLPTPTGSRPRGGSPTRTLAS
jgi:DNA-binding response OmpR family regulator